MANCPGWCCICPRRSRGCAWKETRRMWMRRPFCAKHDLGGMEGLIGVPGSVGGALRMNAGAYGTQIGPHVREVELYRAASGQIETPREPAAESEERRLHFQESRRRIRGPDD